MAKYYYNGVLLPEIPSEAIDSYSYFVIVHEKSVELDIDIKHLYASNSKMYKISNGSDDGKIEYVSETLECAAIYNSGTETWDVESVGVQYAGAGYDICEVVEEDFTLTVYVLWSNYDIPNGSADSTEIYLEASDPVPYSEKLYSVQETTLKSIADSIRAKTGKKDLITPENMPSEIEGISSGGMSERDFILAVVDAVAEKATINIASTFYARKLTTGKYYICLMSTTVNNQFINLYKNDTTLSRGNFDLYLIVSRGSTGYGLKYYTNEAYTIVPLTVGSYTTCSYSLTDYAMHIDNFNVHPAIEKYYTNGEEFNTNDLVAKICFNDFFTLSGYDSSYDNAMVYKWGDSIFLIFFKSTNLPFLDYTNNYIDFNHDDNVSNHLRVNIVSGLQAYVDYETSNAWDSFGKIEITLATSTTAQGSSQFSTLISDLEANVYFNSFDLKDENGNVMLKANCSIEDFI